MYIFRKSSPLPHSLLYKLLHCVTLHLSITVETGAIAKPQRHSAWQFIQLAQVKPAAKVEAL